MSTCWLWLTKRILFSDMGGSGWHIKAKFYNTYQIWSTPPPPRWEWHEASARCATTKRKVWFYWECSRYSAQHRNDNMPHARLALLKRYMLRSSCSSSTSTVVLPLLNGVVSRRVQLKRVLWVCKVWQRCKSEVPWGKDLRVDTLEAKPHKHGWSWKIWRWSLFFF